MLFSSWLNYFRIKITLMTCCSTKASLSPQKQVVLGREVEGGGVHGTYRGLNHCHTPHSWHGSWQVGPTAGPDIVVVFRICVSPGLCSDSGRLRSWTPEPGHPSRTRSRGSWLQGSLQGVGQRSVRLCWAYLIMNNNRRHLTPKNYSIQPTTKIGMYTICM